MRRGIWGSNGVSGFKLVPGSQGEAAAALITLVNLHFFGGRPPAMSAFVLDFGRIGGGLQTMSSLYHTSAQHQLCVNMGFGKHSPRGFHIRVLLAKVTAI